MNKYKTNYHFYAKDEFGEDNTPQRDRRRYLYICATIILIIFDILVQLNLFTSMFFMYYFLDEETFIETFSMFGFNNNMRNSNIDSSQ